MTIKKRKRLSKRGRESVKRKWKWSLGTKISLLLFFILVVSLPLFLLSLQQQTQTKQFAQACVAGSYPQCGVCGKPANTVCVVTRTCQGPSGGAGNIPVYACDYGSCTVKAGSCGVTSNPGGGGNPPANNGGNNGNNGTAGLACGDNGKGGSTGSCMTQCSNGFSSGATGANHL